MVGDPMGAQKLKIRGVWGKTIEDNEVKRKWKMASSLDRCQT